MAKTWMEISVMGVYRFFTPSFHAYHTYCYRIAPHICDRAVLKRREMAFFFL
ncbi:MAG: hypothetical protein OES26_17040 [Gammaproteobacteria bacterium]|nr:hypothetical protein [Gammaproteobacteria bacterium]